MVHGAQRRGGRPRPGKLPDQDLTAPSEEPPPLSHTQRDIEVNLDARSPYPSLSINILSQSNKYRYLYL